MPKDSLFPTYTERAFADGHLRLTHLGRAEKVFCVAVDYPARWSDPEEKVRAEFYAELIYRYDYPPNRIGVEVTVPDRSPNDYADLLVFRDDERKRPYAAIECTVVEGVGNMDTCEAVLRVDKKSYADPSVGPKMDAILRKQPRLGVAPTTKGCEVAHHPEDIHLRLAIRNGNKSLRDKLRALL